MKQKLFYGALLLGALSLSSCVDNNETASVTNIRQSKAEQLKSLANLKSADAQALLIGANAQAEAEAAVSAYNKAKAAYFEAQADYQTAQTEKARQDAQQRAENFAIEMQKEQNRLQTEAIQFEINMINAKKNLVDAQTAYDDAVKKAADDEAADLQELLDAYQTASEDLRTAKWNLAWAKINLSKVKSDVITTVEGFKLQIDQNNKQIAEYKSRIDNYNAQLAAYEKYTTLTEAYEAKERVQQELDQCSYEVEDKEAILNKVQREFDEAYGDEYDSKLDDSKYVQTINEVLNSESINGVCIAYVYNDYANGRPTAANEKQCAQYYDDKTGKTVNIPLFSDKQSTSESVEYSYGEGQSINRDVTYEVYTEYYDLVEGGFDEYIKVLEASVAANQGKALTAAQTEHKKAADAVTAAETKLAEAKKALADAAEADKPAKQNDVEAAQADLNSKNAVLDQALTAQNEAEDRLNDVNEQIAAVKANYKVLTDNAATNAANVKAYNDAAKAVAEAKVQKNIAWYNWNVKYFEQQAIDKVIECYDDGDGNSYATLKDQAENKINGYQYWIDYYTSLNAGLQQDIDDAQDNPDTDDQIKGYEVYIEKLEASIAPLEKNYNAAKAALDAAMAEEEAE